ncbi:MAG: hypothetical protein V4580_16610 [Bacteroidota bacterium]
MKAIIKTSLIITMLMPLLTYSKVENKTDTTETIECLKIIGLALDENNHAIDGVDVRLFRQNDLIEQKEITSVEHHDHNFTFTLESNEYYTVKISKPGFVERWIVFYTDFPSEKNMESLLYYEFEVVLMKEKKMDDYYLDFPIALIHYNEKKDAFENNTMYTTYIKTKIKEAEDLAIQKK